MRYLRTQRHLLVARSIHVQIQRDHAHTTRNMHKCTLQVPEHGHITTHHKHERCIHCVCALHPQCQLYMDKHVDAQLDGCTTAGRRCPHNRCAPELFEGRLSTSPSQCDTWIVLDLGHRVEAASIAPKKLIWRQQRAYVIHHATVRARPVQLVASDPI